MFSLIVGLLEFILYLIISFVILICLSNLFIGTGFTIAPIAKLLEKIVLTVFKCFIYACMLLYPPAWLAMYQDLTGDKK